MPDALVMVMPGVVKMNVVVRIKVTLASAAPSADAIGLADPMIRATAVMSSIVLMNLAWPLSPKTPNQPMNGLFEMSGEIS